MAEEMKLGKGKEYVFRDARIGGAAKYPWEKWFNGTLWLLKHDQTDETGKIHKKDYDVPTNSMPAKLKQAARRLYKICQVGRFDVEGKRLDDALVIRARDMTDEEKQAEDLLRAEEKEAALGKKAEKKRIIEAGKRALADQTAQPPANPTSGAA